MIARQLLDSLILTARRQETDVHEDIIRLKERAEQLRQHRMEMESVADALKAEAKDKP